MAVQDVRVSAAGSTQSSTPESLRGPGPHRITHASNTLAGLPTELHLLIADALPVKGLASFSAACKDTRYSLSRNTAAAGEIYRVLPLVAGGLRHQHGLTDAQRQACGTPILTDEQKRDLTDMYTTRELLRRDGQDVQATPVAHPPRGPA
ncbi:MAG TPA: hypothetical protein VF169_11090 [Albitalea sp.]